MNSNEDDNLNNEPVIDEESVTFDDDLNDMEFEDFEMEESFDAIEEKTGINWFNIGMVGGLVLVVGVMGYIFLPTIFGGSGASTQQAKEPFRPSDSALNAQQNQPTEKLSLEEEINAAGGILSNPDLLLDSEIVTTQQQNMNQDESIFESVNNPASISDEEMKDIFTAIEQSTQQIPSAPEVDDEPVIAPVANELPRPADENNNTDDLPSIELPSFESITGIVEDNIIQPVDNAIEEITAPEPDNIVTSPNDETPPALPQANQVDLGEVNARIDDLSERINRLMAAVQAQSNNVAQVQTSQPQQDTKKIESMISKLEKRIDDISAKQKLAVPATPVKTVAPKKAPVKSIPPKVVKPKIVWELRGASPDKAFIAVKGTQNLKTVSVGETLDGIGRITSIAQENGRWIVRGTSGNIYQ